MAVEAVEPVMDKENKTLIVFLLGLAVFSQSLLFGIAYSGTSFIGEETPFRDYLAPSQIISSDFDQTLSEIADSLDWTVVQASQAVAEQSLAFASLKTAPNIYGFGVLSEYLSP